jgi:hypothetical protein
MKFLRTSGYAEGLVGSPNRSPTWETFLEKPFLPDQIAQSVREILGRINGKPEDSSGANTSSEFLSDKSHAG